jgi:SNF2 family DNA or RNA helicase
VYVKLPPAARKIYRDLEKAFIHMWADGLVTTAGTMASASSSMRQIANGNLYTHEEDGDYRVVHKEKITALQDLVESLNGKPVIIMYQFRSDLAEIQEVFPNAPTIGGSNMKKNAAVEEAFNKGEIPVLLGHPASMAHGLNLQKACHHMIWYGLTWNLEEYMQATRRIDRQGQPNHTVFFHYIMAEDTNEDRMADVLSGKTSAQAAVNAAIADARRRMSLD